MEAGAGLCSARVPPGTSSCVYEKDLEVVLPGPQLRFDALQLPALLACELQLAFDVLERLGRELSLLLWVQAVRKSLVYEVECVLGLEHAAGCLLCWAEHWPAPVFRSTTCESWCVGGPPRSRGHGLTGGVYVV